MLDASHALWRCLEIRRELLPALCTACGLQHGYLRGLALELLLTTLMLLAKLGNYAKSSRSAKSSPKTHEATRRMLSVLLRHMDGLDASANVAVIGAVDVEKDEKTDFSLVRGQPLPSVVH